MSARSALLVLLLAAMTLLVVSCQKECSLYGPAPADPSNILGPNKGGPVTYVYPSGGDDAAEIQSALDACEPGGTVMLMGGTFHLGSVVQVDNFCGTLRGAGKDKTVVTTLPGIKIGLVFFHAWEFSSSALFYFHGDGDITVSDMSVLVLGVCRRIDLCDIYDMIREREVDVRREDGYTIQAVSTESDVAAAAIACRLAS